MNKIRLLLFLPDVHILQDEDLKTIVTIFLKTEKTKSFHNNQGCILLPLKIWGGYHIFFVSYFVVLVCFWFLIESGLYPQLNRCFISWK